MSQPVATVHYASIVTVAFHIDPTIIFQPPATIAAGRQGQQYSFDFGPSVLQCVPPAKFTATGLPDGMTLSDVGLFSGTPTASGDFNLEISVTDAGA